MKTLRNILLALLLPSSAMALPGNGDKDGKVLFEKRCTFCHGKDGTRGLFGAKNLQQSRLDDAALISVISNGRRVMPSWKNDYTQSEIARIAAYIKTLRKQN